MHGIYDVAEDPVRPFVESRSLLLSAGLRRPDRHRWVRRVRPPLDGGNCNAVDIKVWCQRYLGLRITAGKPDQRYKVVDPLNLLAATRYVHARSLVGWRRTSVRLNDGATGFSSCG